MKKWLVALTIIFGAGLLTSASLAGQIYFKGSDVYTDYDKQSIDLTNIKGLYINSDIPVEVKPTTGEAYVEFSQSFEDVLGKNPAFELKVENKDNECHINLEQTKEIAIWFLIKKDEAALTVYLPVQALDTLEITHQSYRNRYTDSKLDLTGIDVKNLSINQDHADVILDGKYENIKVLGDGGSSSVHINSKQKANVSLDGEGSYNLEGLFDTVDIASRYGSIKMNTSSPAKVNIDTSDSDIKLEGSYSVVKLLGNDNAINVQTKTLSDITVENSYSSVILDGPLNVVKVNNQCGNIDIQTTANPKSIEVIGEQNSTILRLPSNIPGFKLMRIAGDTEDGEYEILRDGAYITLSRINSDFNIKQQNNDTYTYGDSSLKLMVQVGEGLRILDNGLSAK